MIQLLKKRLAAKVILTILVVCLIPTVFNSVFFYHSASDVVKENVRNRQGRLRDRQRNPCPLSSPMEVICQISSIVMKEYRRS
ncbi:hypothetical protein [Bacillus sp. es.034]|uniref:hypothetical protein n=1 Tax=Bacillus sp. es.034 TaxID=1761763 RepID=UPI00115D2646|nr:hypothetical protein [Bacillus sp. es.034]